MSADVTVRLPEIIGGGYGAFWRCRKRYRVLKGGKASKKSSTAALWYIVHLMKYADANLLVVRRTYNTHRASTLAQLKWATQVLGVSHLWSVSDAVPEMRYRPTGQKILFRGLDDPDKLASLTVERGVLCWVWVEEAFEIGREADFDKLDLSMPRGQLPPPLFKQTTLTFNPWSGTHWLKARFFDRPDGDTATFSTTYRCNEFLDDVDRRRYERMKREHPGLYRVAGLGDWGVAEGLIFERWQVESFDVRALPEPWKYIHVFGLDYGYSSDPTAFIAMAVNPLDKQIYIYDEHYEKRMLNTDIARMITKKGFAKERIRADSAEPKSNEELRRLGILRVRPAVKGADSIRSGIATLQEYTLHVHPACPHTAEELAAYTWDTRSDGSGVNRPVDRDNHLMDAMRYAMADVAHFHPEPPGIHTSRKPAGWGSGFRPQDFAGGWT